MSLPFSGSGNVGGFNIAPAEISLVTALGSAGTSTSSTFLVGASGTLYVVGVLASGQTVLSAKLSATTPIADPASSGTSVTLAGAGARGVIRLASDGSTIYGAVKNVDSNWSSAFTYLDIMVLFGRKVGRQFFWFSPDSMENGGAINSLPGRTN